MSELSIKTGAHFDLDLPSLITPGLHGIAPAYCPAGAERTPVIITKRRRGQETCALGPMAPNWHFISAEAGRWWEGTPGVAFAPMGGPAAWPGDGCWMLHLASVLTIAGRRPPFFVKNGPGFHQSLIGLHLAFPLPRFPHRMLASGCSLLRPEQSPALAADPGPAGLPAPWLSASRCPSALASHTHGFSARTGWGLTHPLRWTALGSATLPLSPSRQGPDVTPEGLAMHSHGLRGSLPPVPALLWVHSTWTETSQRPSLQPDLKAQWPGPEEVGQPPLHREGWRPGCELAVPVWAPAGTPHFPLCLPGAALLFLLLPSSLLATLGKGAFSEIVVTSSPLLLTFGVSLHPPNSLRHMDGHVSTFKDKRGYMICPRAYSL